MRGSKQLIRYRRARAFGHDVASAAAFAPIPVGEAWSWEAHWARLPLREQHLMALGRL